MLLDSIFLGLHTTTILTYALVLFFLVYVASHRGWTLTENFLFTTGTMMIIVESFEVPWRLWNGILYDWSTQSIPVALTGLLLIMFASITIVFVLKQKRRSVRLDRITLIVGVVVLAWWAFWMNGSGPIDSRVIADPLKAVQSGLIARMFIGK